MRFLSLVLSIFVFVIIFLIVTYRRTIDALLWFVVGVLHPGNIEGHIRTGPDLCALMGDFIELPHWEDQATSTMV